MQLGLGQSGDEGGDEHGEEGCSTSGADYGPRGRCSCPQELDTGHLWRRPGSLAREPCPPGHRPITPRSAETTQARSDPLETGLANSSRSRVVTGRTLKFRLRASLSRRRLGLRRASAGLIWRSANAPYGYGPRGRVAERALAGASCASHELGPFCGSGWANLRRRVWLRSSDGSSFTT
jgi:hypothetical protein